MEDEGGEMRFARKGLPAGGAWIVTLRGRTSAFQSNGAGFPPMDRLYMPRVPEPSHWRDYTNDLTQNASRRWLDTLAHGTKPYMPD